MKCQTGNNCCVAKQLYGFNNHDTVYEQDNTKQLWFGPYDAVRTVALECGYDHIHIDGEIDAAQILWSVAWDAPYKGQCRKRKTVMDRYNAMCRYIDKHKLGTVTRIPTVINPNHGSYVKTAVWNMDSDGMAAWVKKNGLQDNEYDDYYADEHEV